MYTFEDLLEDIYNSKDNGSSRERIYKKYGGFMMYVPQKPTDDKERILQEYNGYNANALARKYNLSEYSVRRLVRQNTLDKTPSLFE